MSQEINLLNPALAPKAQLFKGQSVLIGLGALLLLCLMASLAVGLDARRLTARERAQSERLAQLNSDVTRMGQEVAARKPSAKLQNELAALDALLAARNEVMAMIGSGALGDTRGVSDYFRAFARQRLEGVWLTGFSIHNAGADIVVQGRTLKADLVPVYLQSLRRESALRGHGFAAVSVSQPPRPVAGVDGKPQDARFLEFRLATLAQDAERDLRDGLRSAGR
jgi:hypothetical protein